MGYVIALNVLVAALIVLVAAWLLIGIVWESYVMRDWTEEEKEIYYQAVDLRYMKENNLPPFDYFYK